MLGGAKAAGRHETTWLTQPMDQNIYSEWDTVAQSEWSRVWVQAGVWAPERGVVACQREQDEMRQEIHFLRRNMELLLARTLEGEQPVPPNDVPPGPSEPQPPQPPWRQRRLKARFDRMTETLAYFLVKVEAHMEGCGGDYEDEIEQVHEVEMHMEKHGSDYEDEVEQVHEVGALLEGEADGLYVEFYKSRAPKLRSFPHFMLALQGQFEDPFEEKAQVRLWQIPQGSQSLPASRGGPGLAGADPSPGDPALVGTVFSPSQLGLAVITRSQAVFRSSPPGVPTSLEEGLQGWGPSKCRGMKVVTC
uniref:Uncharacterized protein n=1 Tax=Sphaerodactylus townsendi TaxID=933632 RepID=A0ACB8F861_9SAUR